MALAAGEDERLSSGEFDALKEGDVEEPVSRPGDFDGDGSVGFSDFFRFADHFGQSQGDVAFDTERGQVVVEGIKEIVPVISIKFPGILTI